MEPKYAKVYDALIERISDMNPGERLDSEVKLASSFNVSPMTVRRALMLLSQKGLTVGIPGRGTFVAERNAGTGAPETALAGFSNDVRAAAAPQTYVRLVSAALETAGQAEQELLHATDKPFIATIRRAHYLDEEFTQLAGIETAIVRADHFTGILGLDLSSDLASLLVRHYTQTSTSLKASRVVRSRNATEEEAKQLHLDGRDALLIVETAFDDPAGTTLAEITTKFIGAHVELTF